MLQYNDTYVDVTCHDARRFRQWPDAELDTAILLLQETERRAVAGSITKGRAEEIRQACGLHYTGRGLLSSRILRANCSLLGIVTYDWVHTLLQDGVFVLEAALVLEGCGMHVEVALRAYAQ